MKRAGFLLAAAAFAFWTAALLGQARPRVSRPRPPRQVGPRPALPSQAVTFNKQIARILQASCQKCHHEGDIAPFPLMTYQDAFDHRFAMADQTGRRLMPPWHVDSSCGGFEDDPSLSGEDIRAIGEWVASGAPEGDPRDLPPPLTFTPGWSLGPPDQVLAMEESFTPSFTQGDVYRCFVMPTGLTADRFVAAVEVAPGGRAMVHHVLLFVDSADTAERLDRADPGPGYTCFGGPGFTPTSALGGWAPGNRPRLLPEGVGMHLPKDSRVVMQVHYSARSGVLEPDRTLIGLHFSKAPVQKRLLAVPVLNYNFLIPAGAKDHEVRASIPYIPFDAHALAVTPHMHLLGKRMNLTATLPDGRQVCLVNVPDWDFHWQGTYFYRSQVPLPVGTRVDLSAWYDNSSENPQNPSRPPRNVTWGEATTDEMCLAFLSFTLDAENLTGAAGLAATGLATFSPFWEEGWLPGPSGDSRPLPGSPRPR